VWRPSGFSDHNGLPISGGEFREKKRFGDHHTLLKGRKLLPQFEHFSSDPERKKNGTRNTHKIL
jgi:hypothetical protein